MTVRQPTQYNVEAFVNAMEEFSRFFQAMASSTRALMSINEDVAAELVSKQEKIDAIDSSMPAPKLETPTEKVVEPINVAPAPQPAQIIPEVTFEEIQSMAKALAIKGKSKQIHDILQQYGAVKLSEIDPKYYISFSVDLKNLGEA